MKYIIMCGGTYPKWGETPRQLLKLPSGETIVGRTIRLLRENGVTNVAISTNNEAFGQFGLPLLHHDNTWVAGKSGLWLEAFYPTDEPVCYIFGDVVYSENAIRTIVNQPTTDIDFFASAGPFDHRYIKDYCEPFCFKVVNTKRFFECLKICAKYYELGMLQRSPIAWEVWQVCSGGKLNFIDRNFIVISDWTCDIDSPDDLNRLNMRVHI